jgi:DNA-binding transcriptional LysR family regulator
MVVYRSDGNGTVLAFVAAGTVALVSEVALDGHDERVCVLDVDGLVAPRRIGLAWHRERQPSPAAMRLMGRARSVCGPSGAARVREGRGRHRRRVGHRPRGRPGAAG